MVVDCRHRGLGKCFLSGMALILSLQEVEDKPAIDPTLKISCPLTRLKTVPLELVGDTLQL